MGRIVNTGSAGRDRLWLEKGIVIAIRELTRQSSVTQLTYDLVAYIALSLKAIGNTIEESVTAWEKRGYWIKADRYRMEWMWSSKSGEDLEKSLVNEDWGKVTQIIATVSQKLAKINVPVRNRLGTPWIGASARIKRSDQQQ